MTRPDPGRLTARDDRPHLAAGATTVRADGTDLGPGAIVGAYRLTHLLGAGGMGQVFAAEHTLLGRAAAVKVLRATDQAPDDAIARFFNEARAATAIRHPGIVEVFDFGYRDDGVAYLVMERLDGESLADRLRRGPLAPALALTVTRQIAGALAAAHACGIIHRDLKPDNVFLVADPEVPGGERIKLLDFGIAKLCDGRPAGPDTAVGMVLGTPTYMAPEQCRGGPLDGRADLYALGCLLFEMCSGAPPFAGRGVAELIAAHLHEPPPPLAAVVPTLDPTIDALTRRLLAKARTERPRSAHEVVVAIDRATGGAARAHASSSFATTGGRAVIARAAVGGGASLLAAAAIALALANSGATLDEATPAAVAGPPASTPATAAVASTVPSLASAPSAPSAPPPPPASASVTPAVVTPTLAPRPSGDVAIAISSSPPGAAVALDGVAVGVTPFVGRWPPRERLAITLRLPGHRPARQVIDARRAVAVDVVLTRRPAAAPRPTPRPDQSVNPFAP
jgi:hypothetical protein